MTRAARALLGGALLAASLAPGCARPLASWDRTLDDWTRREETWEDFESRLFVKATLKTEPLRREYARAYAHVFALDERGYDRLLEAELADEREAFVVVAAIFTHDSDWADLRPRSGVWDVRLENAAGDRVRPLDVRELKLDNPTWRRLFPYIAYHDTFWEVRFPRTTPAGAPLARPGDDVFLVIAGAPARVRLAWTLP